MIKIYYFFPCVAELGAKPLADLLKDKIVPFEGGPYFILDGKDSEYKFLNKVIIQNFSLITRGRSKHNQDDFWSEKQSFMYDGRIEGERVTGVVGLTIELIDALITIETTKSNDIKMCRMIGSSREFSPIGGKSNNYIGNPDLKILFQDTVIKKPFVHIVSEFMLDTTTRPIYSTFNGTVAQPFYFDFQVDPNCVAGLDRDEVDQVETFIGQSLRVQMKDFLMDSFIREGYLMFGVVPYAQILFSNKSTSP